jgi:hypothetical protein
MHAVYSIFYAADGVGEKSACLLHLAEEKQPAPAVAAVLRLPPGPGPGPAFWFWKPRRPTTIRAHLINQFTMHDLSALREFRRSIYGDENRQRTAGFGALI